MFTQKTSKCILSNFQSQPQPREQIPHKLQMIGAVSQQTENSLTVPSLYSQTTSASAAEHSSQTTSLLFSQQSHNLCECAPKFNQAVPHSSHMDCGSSCSQYCEDSSQHQPFSIRARASFFGQSSHSSRNLDFQQLTKMNSNLSTSTFLTATFANLKNPPPSACLRTVSPNLPNEQESTSLESKFINTKTFSLAQKGIKSSQKSEKNLKLESKHCKIIRGIKANQMRNLKSQQKDQHHSQAEHLSRSRPRVLIQMRSIKNLDRQESEQINRLVAVKSKQLKSAISKKKSHKTLELIYHQLPRKYLQNQFLKALKEEKQSLPTQRLQIEETKKGKEVQDFQKTNEDQRPSWLKSGSMLGSSRVSQNCFSKRIFKTSPSRDLEREGQAVTLQQNFIETSQRGQVKENQQARQIYYKSKAILKKPKLKTLLPRSLVVAHSNIRRKHQLLTQHSSFVQFDNSIPIEVGQLNIMSKIQTKQASSMNAQARKARRVTDDEVAQELREYLEKHKQSIDALEEEDNEYSTNQSSESVIYFNSIECDQKEILLRKFESQVLKHKQEKQNASSTQQPSSIPINPQSQHPQRNAEQRIQIPQQLSFTLSNGSFGNNASRELTQRVIIGSPQESGEENSQELNRTSPSHQNQQSSSYSCLDDLNSELSFSQYSNQSLIRPFPQLGNSHNSLSSFEAHSYTDFLNGDEVLAQEVEEEQDDDEDSDDDLEEQESEADLEEDEREADKLIEERSRISELLRSCRERKREHF